MSDPHHGKVDDPPTLHDVDKPGTILGVWVVVIGLAAANIGLSMAHLGKLALPVQLVIGSVQAYLVAYYWMHMRRKDQVVTLSALSALFFMGIMFFLIFSDYTTRRLVDTFQTGPEFNLRGR
jgi:cytochrome c oxidase subunit 4